MILTYINSGDFMYDDILQHIPGDDLKSQIPYLPHDKLLYFICDTGKTAKKMAEQCQQLGFQCQYFPHSFQSLLILKNEQYF